MFTAVATPSMNTESVISKISHPRLTLLHAETHRLDDRGTPQESKVTIAKRCGPLGLCKVFHHRPVPLSSFVRKYTPPTSGRGDSRIAPSAHFHEWSCRWQPTWGITAKIASEASNTVIPTEQGMTRSRDDIVDYASMPRHASRRSSNDRLSLAVRQELAVPAVIVNGLAIGAEPGGPWACRCRRISLSPPTCFTHSRRADSVSVQGYSKRLPSCMTKSSCRWHCGASNVLQIASGKANLSPSRKRRQFQPVRDYDGDVGVPVHPSLVESGARSDTPSWFSLRSRPLLRPTPKLKYTGRPRAAMPSQNGRIDSPSPRLGFGRPGSRTWCETGIRLRRPSTAIAPLRPPRQRSRPRRGLPEC